MDSKRQTAPAQQGQTLDELMAEWEPERLAQIERDDTPEARARTERKRVEEFERGVRLGWHDAEGNPLPSDDEIEDEDDRPNDHADWE